MATVLNNRTVTNIGTTATTVVQTGVSQRYTVIGFSLTNVLDENVLVDVLIDGGYYLKDVIVPIGSSLRAVSNGEKLVLGVDSTVEVRASKNLAIDCIISYAAIYSNPNPDNINFLAGNNITLTRVDNEITIGADLSSVNWRLRTADSSILQVNTDDILSVIGENTVDVYFDNDSNLVVRGPDLAPYALRTELRYFLSVDDDTYKEVNVEDTVKFVGGLNITTSRNESDNIVIDGPDISNFIVIDDVQFTVSSSTQTKIKGINSDIKFLGGTNIDIEFDSNGAFLINGPDTSAFITEDIFEWYLIGDDTGRSVLNNNDTFGVKGGLNITTKREGNNIIVDGPDLSDFITANEVYWSLYADDTFEPRPIILGQELRIEGGVSISTRLNEFGTLTIDGEPYLQKFSASEPIEIGTVIALRSDGKVEPVKETAFITDGQFLNSALATINSTDNIETVTVESSHLLTVYTDLTDADAKILVTQVGLNGVVAPGLPRQFVNSSAVSSIAYDPVNEKFGIFYAGNAVVGEIVNGNDSSLQAPVSWTTVGNNTIQSIYHPHSGNILILYKDDTDNFYGKAVVATLSTTPITFGPVVTWSSVPINEFAATYDPVTKNIIFTYSEVDGAVYCVTASITGTTVTVNTADVAQVSDGTADYPSIAMLTGTGKLVVAYRDYTSNYDVSAKVGIVAVSQTEVLFEFNKIPVYTDNSTHINVVYTQNIEASDRITFTFKDTVTGIGKFRSGVVNPTATDIVFDPVTEEISSPIFFPHTTYESFKDQFYFTYQSQAGSNLFIKTYTSATSVITTNALNYLGIAKDFIGVVGEGICFVNGNVANTLSNLIPNRDYYVTSTGGISINQTPYGIIGRSLSETELLLQTDAYPRQYLDDQFASQADDIADIVAGRFNIRIAADDSTQVSLGINSTVQFKGGIGISTSSDADGNITIDGATTLTVNLTDPSNNIIKNVNNVSTINFDNDSGFDIDPGTGSVKVKLNSTFKYWKVAGQSDLVAEGLDEIELIAGPGILLETYPDRDPTQRIKISGFSGFRVAGDDSVTLSVTSDNTFNLDGGANITSYINDDNNGIRFDLNTTLNNMVTINVTTVNATDVSTGDLDATNVETTNVYTSKITRAPTVPLGGIHFQNDTFKTIQLKDDTGIPQIYLECATGNILATGDITTEYTSDERLKDVIGTIENTLDSINKITPIKFSWNDLAQKTFNYNATTEELGFKAQEIKKYFPELVIERGNTGFLKVDYQKFTVVLLAAVKEMDSKIQKLERKLDELEKRIGR